jgi:Amt family ammonium transporter
MFDTGNTAFMLVAASLVMLMTPGLAFFYGGLVGRKNVLTIMIQSFVSMGVTTIIWWMYGYSLCFSGGVGGIIGNLDKAFLHGVTLNTLCPFGDGRIPEFVFMAYQMMFAIITPALITGAFSNRVRFPAYLAFLVGWLTFVYFPFAHGLGRGLLAKLGVLDFAGGIVVHNIAGMAALASVLYVGRRRVGDSIPHSIPLVALGAGLLWFGWYGFNAGSQLKVDSVTGLAFLNTDIAASFAGPTWLLLAWIFERKPKFLGLLTGAVAGLATITPCAGYVTPTSAALIGIAAGGVCYFAVNLKNRLKWDDALDVWGVHGVGGALGIVLLGLMADKAVNAAGANGLFRGDSLLHDAGRHGGRLVGVRLRIHVRDAEVHQYLHGCARLWTRRKRVSTRRYGESAYDEEVVMARCTTEPLPVSRRQTMSQSPVRRGIAVLGSPGHHSRRI